MIIIDRFEGDTAVLETDSGMLDVQRSELPENASVGDVLTFSFGRFAVDAAATARRRATAANRFSALMRIKND